MILAFAKVMIDAKHNPAERLWVQCQDIDRTAALMCYLQLSLWNIPGVVVVGNTLSMETRGCFYTPAHYFGRWDDRLAVRRAREVMRQLIQGDVNRPVAATIGGAHQAPDMVEAAGITIRPVSKPSPGASGTQEQFNFGF